MTDEVAIDLLYLGLLDRGHDQGGWDHWHAKWSSFENVTDFYEEAMTQPEYLERFVPEGVALVGLTPPEPSGTGL